MFMHELGRLAQESLCQLWTQTLHELQLPRFTKRYPELIDALLFRLLEMVVQMSEAMGTAADAAQAQGGQDDKSRPDSQGDGDQPDNRPEDAGQSAPQADGQQPVEERTLLSPMKVLDPNCKPPSFPAAQLSECLQRCLTPQSVPPGLALPATPTFLPCFSEQPCVQPKSLPLAVGPPEMEPQVACVESPEKTAGGVPMVQALRNKEGSELVSLGRTERQKEPLEAQGGRNSPFGLLGQFLSRRLVCEDICRLACDVHASPVISQLISLPDLAPDLRRRLVSSLRGSLLKLTRDKRGCWVLQQALELGGPELQDALKDELKGKVLSCSQHLHGNFVLQKCVELLPDNLERLVTDAYGHNVLRALLVHGSGAELRRIVESLFAEEGKLLVYARNRHASLVLDQCLEALSGERAQELKEERDAVMSALLGEGSTSVFSLML
eukprot:g5101.t1